MKRGIERTILVAVSAHRADFMRRKLCFLQDRIQQLLLSLLQVIIAIDDTNKNLEEVKEKIKEKQKERHEKKGKRREKDDRKNREDGEDNKDNEDNRHDRGDKVGDRKRD